MRNLWDVILRHLAKWRGRIVGIKELRVEGFEVFGFALMACLFAYFSTSWFTGVYTIALKAAMPLWIWRTVTGGLSLIILLGFLEEHYALRRIGSGVSALFLWAIGVTSAVIWPHWFIGWLFCLISSVPTWLWTKIAEIQIKDKVRSLPQPAAVVERDPPIVKLPRRA